MVFSTSAARSTAVVAPCVKPVNQFADLQAEAQRLAVAEGLADGDGPWKTFGAVGILLNSASLDARTMLEPWTKYFSEHFNTGCKATTTKANGEEPSLRRDGVLNVAWPESIATGKSHECDILLATANAPNLNVDGSYPTAQQIADRFIQQQYIKYFFENIRNGIYSADDPEIWARVQEANPEWMTRTMRASIDDALRGFTC
jgi:hypothetical protein